MIVTRRITRLGEGSVVDGRMYARTLKHHLRHHHHQNKRSTGHSRIHGQRAACARQMSKSSFSLAKMSEGSLAIVNACRQCMSRVSVLCFGLSNFTFFCFFQFHFLPNESESDSQVKVHVCVCVWLVGCYQTGAVR